MAAPFRDDPGPHEIAPPSGSPRNRASDPGAKESAPAIRGPDESAPAISLGGFVGWSREAELPPGQRRRVTHLASGKRSPHSPEIVDRFTLSASGNRWAL